MRVDTRARHRNAPRPAWKCARSFGQWLRGRNCACQGNNPDCSGPIQAAHTPHAASRGMNSKVADRYQIPLSEGCHIFTQHRIGWPEFARRFLDGNDPTKMAEAYWQKWPGRIQWEREQANV